jgi:sugar (pentulose or hexulose) kinase
VGGAAFEWLRDLVFPNVAPAEFYGEALREISGRGTSVVLDPPYLGGDRLEIGESSAAFRNLRLTTTRSDLLAALTEAMRRGHKRALERLGIGDHFNRVVVTGGGAVWAAGLLHDRFEILKEGSLEGVIRLFQQD